MKIAFLAVISGFLLLIIGYNKLQQAQQEELTAERARALLISSDIEDIQCAPRAYIIMMGALRKGESARALGKEELVIGVLLLGWGAMAVTRRMKRIRPISPQQGLPPLSQSQPLATPPRAAPAKTSKNWAALGLAVVALGGGWNWLGSANVMRRVAVPGEPGLVGAVGSVAGGAGVKDERAVPVAVPPVEVPEISKIRQAANEGITKAQYNLGVCYDEGSGVPQDKVEAVEWYRKAAASAKGAVDAAKRIPISEAQAEAARNALTSDNPADFIGAPGALTVMDAGLNKIDIDRKMFPLNTALDRPPAYDPPPAANMKAAPTPAPTPAPAPTVTRPPIVIAPLAHRTAGFLPMPSRFPAPSPPAPR